MNRQPTLQDALVTLRPLTQEDFEPLLQAASDPLIWEQHPRTDRYQRPVFTAFLEEALASGGALVVVENATQQVIGTSRYYGLDSDMCTVLVGYTFLIRRCWGKGHNAAMKRLMLAHAAAQGMVAVLFQVGPDNRRSRVAVERLGAVPVPSEDPTKVTYRLDL